VTAPVLKIPFGLRITTGKVFFEPSLQVNMLLNSTVTGGHFFWTTPYTYEAMNDRITGTRLGVGLAFGFPMAVGSKQAAIKGRFDYLGTHPFRSSDPVHMSQLGVQWVLQL
jgi:hypothetical protein